MNNKFQNKPQIIKRQIKKKKEKKRRIKKKIASSTYKLLSLKPDQ